MGRYELRRELGRGGMGVVYEAFDRQDQALVALKTIVANHPAVAENLYRLKQEFRAAADLQHPNLIRFGELASHEGQWFFTMELVRGCTFLEYVRPKGDDARGAPYAFDEQRLRAALAQVTSALAAIHGAGQIHRDVKPSNVLVTDEGRVVVLDFGLMTALAGPGTAQLEEGPIGTPDFMAPEQIEDTEVGPAADWYALGSMLFVALTGRTPFVGGPVDVMTAKMQTAAPAPSTIAPGIPADLDALCVELLRPFAEHRPSAGSIRSRLGLPAAESGAQPVADSTPTFIGRAKELADLTRAFGDAVAERGGAVSIEGEPGIGKSALVQAFLATVRDDALVLSGRCYEQESVPFKGIDSIVDALSQFLLALPESQARSLLAEGVRFLATVFPVLNRVPLVAETTSNARSIDNPLALREQAFGELERLFARLSRRRRVIVFLDDLQWADRDSIALLHRLLRQDPPIPFLFLTTMRTGVGLPPGANELLEDAARIALSGLSRSECGLLCSTLWQAGGGSPDSVPDQEALARDAGGHPLYLSELLRAARRGEEPQVRPGKLTEVLWQRIQERDPLERRFLEVLALAGAPLAYDVVARAAELDVGECQTRLGSLRAAQLVLVSRRGGERLVVPYHDRVRESVLAHRMNGDESGRRSVALDRLRLGRALLASTDLDEIGGRIFSIVQYMNAGRALLETRDDQVQLAQLNLVAAREAELATAYHAATHYAGVGLELLGEGGWVDAYGIARDLQVERMRAEALAGEIALARASLDAGRARITAPLDRTELYIAWIELESHRGAFQSALDAGRERLRELGVSFPRRLSPISVLWQYVATRRVQAGRSTDELRALGPTTDPRHESAMRVLMAMTPAAYWTSSDHVGWISLKLAETSMRYGVCDASSYGFASYGVIVTGAFRRCADAAALGKLALALNERAGNASLSARLKLIHGQYLAPWVQPFREARRFLEASYDAAVKHGDTTYEAFAAVCRSHLLTLESADVGAQYETAAWAREVCSRRNDWNTAGSALGHLRYAATLRGSSEGFDLSRGCHVDAGFEQVAGSPDKTPAAYAAYWVFGAWAAYLFGRTRVAVEWLAETRRFAHGYFGSVAMLDLCLLESLVAARLHDSAPWGRRLWLRARMALRLRKLRAWSRGCPQNFEPHYLIARAELARVRGRSEEAAASFEQAADSARSRGAGLREALALELGSAFAAGRGDTSRAERMREEALLAYRRCGATAKADALSGGR
jgi:predicted ATPase